MIKRWTNLKKVTANAPDNQVISYFSGDVEKVGHVRHAPPRQKSDVVIDSVTAEDVKETKIWWVDDNVVVIVNDCLATRRS